jgi:hypothetical protein
LRHVPHTNQHHCLWGKPSWSNGFLSSLPDVCNWAAGWTVTDAKNLHVGSGGIHVGRKVVCKFKVKGKLVPFQGTVTSFDSTVGWYVPS